MWEVRDAVPNHPEPGAIPSPSPPAASTARSPSIARAVRTSTTGSRGSRNACASRPASNCAGAPGFGMGGPDGRIGEEHARVPGERGSSSPGAPSPGRRGGSRRGHPRMVRNCSASLLRPFLDTRARALLFLSFVSARVFAPSNAKRASRWPAAEAMPCPSGPSSRPGAALRRHPAAFAGTCRTGLFDEEERVVCSYHAPLANVPEARRSGPDPDGRSRARSAGTSDTRPALALHHRRGQQVRPRPRARFRLLQVAA